jgi:hypothetical protein
LYLNAVFGFNPLLRSGGGVVRQHMHRLRKTFGKIFNVSFQRMAGQSFCNVMITGLLSYLLRCNRFSDGAISIGCDGCFRDNRIVIFL